MASIILVTGANGFIGSHTTLLMESLGHKVIAVDAVPRSADLSLLGIKTPSHIMDVTDSTSFRNALRPRKANPYLSRCAPAAKRRSLRAQLLLSRNDQHP